MDPRKVLVAATIISITFALSTIVLEPAHARRAAENARRACGNQGCLGDTCVTAAGYWCSKLQNGCYGNHCEKT